MFKKFNIALFVSFFLKAKSIFIITLYSIFDLLDTVVFPVSIAALGIFSIVRGVELFYSVAKFVNLPSSLINTVYHNHHILRYLMGLGVLAYSVKTTVVQIGMIHLFAIIASELALLLILASIVLLRGFVGNVKSKLNRAFAKQAYPANFGESIQKSAGLAVKLMLFAILFSTVFSLTGSAHASAYLRNREAALFSKAKKDGLVFKALTIGNINIPRISKKQNGSIKYLAVNGKYKGCFLSGQI